MSGWPSCTTCTTCTTQYLSWYYILGNVLHVLRSIRNILHVLLFHKIIINYFFHMSASKDVFDLVLHFLLYFSKFFNWKVTFQSKILKFWRALRVFLKLSTSKWPYDWERSSSKIHLVRKLLSLQCCISRTSN